MPSDQLFNDEVLRIVLNYSNSNRRDMEGDDKLIGKISMELRDLVKSSLAAGKSVHDVVQEFRALGPILAGMRGNVQNPRVLDQAQRILGRYTPERTEDVARFSEMRRNLGVESSGTESLRSALKQVADELAFTRRRQMTQAGQFNQATGNSPIGTGLMIDVEAAMRPIRQVTGFVADSQRAFSQHLVEASAVLFTFHKETGQILEPMRQFYTGLQDLKNYTHDLIMPRGISRDMLQGQSISPAAILSLARLADVFVAHNAPYDRREISKPIPELEGMRPWLDTMRGIPWRDLGQSSRALQDLLRVHGIDPVQAHRGLTDANSTIRLLGSSPQSGTPNYMSMLLGGGGRVTIDQEILHEIKRGVNETQSRLRSTLGEAPRYGFAQQAIEQTMSSVQRRSNALVGRFDPELIRKYFPDIQLEAGRTVQLSRIASISGGPTVRGIKGTGGVPEPTPQGIGSSGIALQNQLSLANEFVRNLTMHSGPLAATNFLQVYRDQAQRQETRQSYSKRALSREDIRSGEDVMFDVMRGTNRYLSDQRLIESGERVRREPSPRDRDAEWRDYHRRNMLSQSWAQPTGGFSAIALNSREIEEARRTRNPSMIQRAAMMANIVGQGHPQYDALLDIVEGGQARNREARQGQRLLSAATPPEGGFKSWGIVRGAKKFMSEEEGTIDLGRLGSLFKSVFGAGAPGAPATDYASQLKGMRREDSITRMYAAANKAAAALEEYERIIAPQKAAQAATRLAQSQEKLAASLEQDVGKVDARAATLAARIQGRMGILGQREERTTERFNDSLSRAAYGEINAGMRVEAARATVAARQARVERMNDGEYWNRLNPAQKERLTQSIQAPLTSAQLREQYAVYRRQALQASSPEEVEGLRQSTAASMASLRVPGDSEEARLRRAALGTTYYNALPGGRGGRGVAEAENRAILDEQRKLAQDTVNLYSKTAEQKEKIREKYAKSGAKGEEEYHGKIAALEQGSTRAYEKLSSLRGEADVKAARARERFALEDAAGGGGRGGGRGGGGGGGFGGARGGLDFGLGLAAFAGGAVALREITLEATQYAARTEQLRIVTEHMARTNFIAVESLNPYVEALKRQTHTTQEAYSMTQRMIQAQFDLSKAPALGKVAQNLSTITGTSPAESLDRIMMGLVTGYTRQLHMAGLQVSRLSVNRELRGTLDHEPSDFEQRQGLLNATLIEGARTMGAYEQSLTTAAGQFALLNRQIQETKNSIGNQFLPIYGRMLQTITSGLKIVEEHPVAASKLVSGGLSLAAGLGVAGTGAFLSWAGGAALGGLRAMGPVGAAVSIGIPLATSLAAYAVTQRDKSALNIQQARSSIRMIEEARAELPPEAPITGTGNARAELEFQHKYNVEAQRGYAASIVSIQRELTGKLAAEYDQQLTDFERMSDKMNGSEGWWGRVEGFWGMVSTGKLGLGGVRGPKLEGVPDMGITPEQIEGARQYQRKQRRESLSLDPAISKRQVALAEAISGINQAQIEVDQLEHGFEPGGKFEREERRMGTKDNPTQRIQDELDDRIEQLNKSKTYRETVAKEFAASKGTRVDLADALRKAEVVEKDRAETLAKFQRVATVEQAALQRQLEREIIKQRTAVEISGIRGEVVPGNYVSEREGIERIFQQQYGEARKDFDITGDPLDLRKRLSDANLNRIAANKEQRDRQEAAARGRREMLGLDAGAFRAQQIMSQPTANVSNQLARAAGEELKATQSILDDEKRREAQLQILIRLRGELVNRAVEERKIENDLAKGKFANQMELQSAIDKIVTGRGRSSQNDQALESIERERKRALQKINFDFSHDSGADGADIVKLRAEADLAVDSVNKQAAARRVAQLDANEQAARQTRVDALRAQFQKAATVQDLQARGPAEEAAGIQNIFQLRMSYIQQEYEARDKTLEAEKDKHRQMMEAEFDQVQQIMALQKRMYEESRNISGGFFDALTSGQGNAVPQFFKEFLRGQGRVMFQNIVGGPLNNVFKNMAGTLGGQTTIDAQGKVVPTPFGRVLGGTIFAAANAQDPSRMLAHLNKDAADTERDLKVATVSLEKEVAENIVAEKDLTAAVISLDTSVRAIGGLPAPHGVGASAAASVSASGSPAALAASNFLRLPTTLGKTGVGGLIGSLLPELFPLAGKSLSLSNVGVAPSHSLNTTALTFAGGERQDLGGVIKDLTLSPMLSGAGARLGSSVLEDITLSSMLADAGARVNIPREAPGQPGIAQRAFRNNNPGNLTNLDGTFKVFATAADGYRALQEHVGRHSDRGETLGGYISAYAPPTENETEKYIQGAERALGATRETPLSMLDREKLAQFQARQESSTRITQGGGGSALGLIAGGAQLAQSFSGMFPGGSGAGAGAQANLTPPSNAMLGTLFGDRWASTNQAMAPYVAMASAFGPEAAIPARQADVNREGMLIGNTGLMFKGGALVPAPKGANVVDGVVQGKASTAQSLAAGVAAFSNSLGASRYNLYDVLKGSEVRIKGPDRQVLNTSTGEYETVSGSGMEHLSTGQRVGAIAGAGATLIGGIRQANEGFSKGGAKGGISGAAGVLHAASIVPGPQQPFIAAAATWLDVIGSFLGDPKMQRQADIQKYMEANRYLSPTSVTANVAALGGNIVSEGMTGLSRNTGLAGFPINVQEAYRKQNRQNVIYSSVFGGKTYGYEDIPGYQLGPASDQNQLSHQVGPYSGAAGYIPPGAVQNSGFLSSAPINHFTINLPVSAMDGQDVMRRSPDIVAAVAKELALGAGNSDLSFRLSQNTFGAG